MDVTLTLASLPITLPVTLVFAVALAFELRGNPFFLQERVGRFGQPFTMFKLRTMRHAGPGERETYVVDDWHAFVFSPSNERHPRLTRLGAIARRLSIDELPNLLNVLKGDMSLVGPRPEIPELVRQYPAQYHRRHNVLPGITGLAQVRGRSDLTYDEIVSYDLAYVEHHSLSGDLRLLAETFLVVFRREGAR